MTGLVTFLFLSIVIPRHLTEGLQVYVMDFLEKINVTSTRHISFKLWIFEFWPSDLIFQGFLYVYSQPHQ